jgi:hypothetical protein
VRLDAVLRFAEPALRFAADVVFLARDVADFVFRFADDAVFRFVDEALRFVDEALRFVDEAFRFVAALRFVDAVLRFVDAVLRLVDAALRLVDAVLRFAPDAVFFARDPADLVFRFAAADVLRFADDVLRFADDVLRFADDVDRLAADAVFFFAREDADFVFRRADDAVFFARDPVFFAREDADFVLRDAEDCRDDDVLFLSPSSESSSLMSFLATPTAAGIATPRAVPAAIFAGVESPCCSSSSAIQNLLCVARGYAASLNASMNAGTILSRTTSGPCVARYFPAASAASSAIGRSASAAASQLVAAADARNDCGPPPLFLSDDPSSSLLEPLSCERTFFTAYVAAPVAAAAAAAFSAALVTPPPPPFCDFSCSATAIVCTPLSFLQDEPERLFVPLLLLPDDDRFEPPRSLRRDMSASFTLLNVCAALSACSLISSAICMSRSKSVPFFNSLRSSPTSPSRSSARRSTSFTDATSTHPFCRLPLQKTPDRTEVEVEVLVPQAELRLQLFHPLGETHERQAELLNLLVVERSLFHAPQSLAFHQLAQELDKGQHELCEAALDGLRVTVDATRKRVTHLLELPGNRLDVAVRGEEAVEVVAGDAHASAPAKL